MKIFIAFLFAVFSASAFSEPVGQRCYTDVSGCIYTTYDINERSVLYVDPVIYNRIDVATKSDFALAGYKIRQVDSANEPALKASIIGATTSTIQADINVVYSAGEDAFFMGGSCAIGIILCSATTLEPATWLIARSTCIGTGFVCAEAHKKFLIWRDLKEKEEKAKKDPLKAVGDGTEGSLPEAGAGPSGSLGGSSFAGIGGPTPKLKDFVVTTTECPPTDDNCPLD